MFEVCLAHREDNTCVGGGEITSLNLNVPLETNYTLQVQTLAVSHV